MGRFPGATVGCQCEQRLRCSHVRLIIRTKDDRSAQRIKQLAIPAPDRGKIAVITGDRNGVSGAGGASGGGS